MTSKIGQIGRSAPAPKPAKKKKTMNSIIGYDEVKTAYILADEDLFKAATPYKIRKTHSKLTLEVDLALDELRDAKQWLDENEKILLRLVSVAFHFGADFIVIFRDSYHD